MKNMFRMIDKSSGLWLSNQVQFGFFGEQIRQPEDHELNQAIGIQDKKYVDMFEADFLKVERNETNFSSGFERSNTGKIMTQHELDYLLIRLNISNVLSVDYDIFMFKDSKPLTDREFFYNNTSDEYLKSNVSERRLANIQDIHCEHDVDIQFIQYLSAKKVVEVIGNIYKNKDIVDLIKNNV